MKTRPKVGTRVRLSRKVDEAGAGAGKLATVVAHHVDGTAIVVRMDPQTPLRRVRKGWLQWDREHGGFKGKFRRREGDWIVDYYYVTAVAK